MLINIAIYLTIGLILNELAQWRLKANGYEQGNLMFTMLWILAWPLTIVFVFILTIWLASTRGKDE